MRLWEYLAAELIKKQVKEYLDNLNIYDSEGPSHIQPKDLKELAEKDLTDIFETSWKKVRYQRIEEGWILRSRKANKMGNLKQVPTIPYNTKYDSKYITNSVSFHAQQHQNTLLRL